MILPTWYLTQIHRLWPHSLVSGKPLEHACPAPNLTWTQRPRGKLTLSTSSTGPQKQRRSLLFSSALRDTPPGPTSLVRDSVHILIFTWDRSRLSWPKGKGEVERRIKDHRVAFRWRGPFRGSRKGSTSACLPLWHGFTRGSSELLAQLDACERGCQSQNCLARNDCSQSRRN